jgi:hypothetical protein
MSRYANFRPRRALGMLARVRHAACQLTELAASGRHASSQRGPGTVMGFAAQQRQRHLVLLS